MEKFNISTERLELKLLQKSDIDEMYAALLKDPKITYLLTFDPPSCRKDTADFVNWMIPRMPEHDVLWVVRLKGEFIGLIGINDIERKVLAWEINNGNMGYWFVPQVAGQGLATEVAQAILKFGFEELKLHKMSARVTVGNGASKRILEKIGLEKVGVQKKHFFRHGKWWDCMWLEVLNKKFEE